MKDREQVTEIPTSERRLNDATPSEWDAVARKYWATQMPDQQEDDDEE